MTVAVSVAHAQQCISKVGVVVAAKKPSLLSASWPSLGSALHDPQQERGTPCFQGLLLCRSV